jgi:hypothetical protein
MALTGQLSDMSLAELIEFFCNQRKTGRLKIDYPRGHSVFFIKEGELVDAKVGALSGPEAVYFSLTLPNAAFDFSPDVQATRRTIDNGWTQVVLEGLRRLDEGLAPTEADAFGVWSPSETELAQMLDQVEHLETAGQQKPQLRRAAAAREEAAAAPKPAEPTQEETPREDSTREEFSREPFSTMVESAGAGGSKKKKLVLAAVAAAVVLACVVAAVPLLNRPAAKTGSASAASETAQPAAPAEASPADATPAPSGESTEAVNADAAAPDADSAAAAARREALERERRERERRERRDEAARREEAAADDPASANAAANAAAAPKPVAPAGPKSVKVSVTYDEAGRVTQAAVAGTTPGAEAYGSTAVRIARGKRFPAGKPGSTVITIPVN